MSKIDSYFVFFDSCFACFSFWISIPTDPGGGPCLANLNKSPTTDWMKRKQMKEKIPQIIQKSRLFPLVQVVEIACREGLKNLDP